MNMYSGSGNDDIADMRRLADRMAALDPAELTDSEPASVFVATSRRLDRFEAVRTRPAGEITTPAVITAATAAEGRAEAWVRISRSADRVTVTATLGRCPRPPSTISSRCSTSNRSR